MGVAYELEDKVFVVTGGSRGIGLEIAGELLRQQAKVAICGRKQENLDAATAKLDGSDNLLAVAANIAVEGDVENLFDAALKRFGRIDGLVNNAGMNLFVPSAVDAELSRWTRIMDSNLTGTFLCSRKAAKIMKEQKSGKIVSVSSLAASRAVPTLGIYGVAKAGIEMLTKVLAAELAFFNIQVNAVAPGVVRTDFSKFFWENKEFLDLVIKDTPAGRIGETQDISNLVMFLLSSRSDFITGQIIAIDGGSSIV
jgi:NAD(P)-dependent dehydrogenase (short-subunit alcohol dehydrogenase family)